MILEPLGTIQSIQEAVKQDPSLRVSLASKYQGLGGTLSNGAIPLPPETDGKEPLAIFSKDGKATVEEAKNKLAGFMPPEKPTTETPEKTATPETKGGLTFDEAVSLFGQDFTGIQQQPDGTYVPDKTALERLGITSKKSETETALEQSKTEMESIKKQLAGFLIPDEEVQRQIGNISSQWDARANEMREINRRREASLMTTGLRLGSQYTGGLRGGVFGSIISEEERQGVSRIQDLEAKKQEAILAAKQAQRENNYTVLVKQADLLEKSYNKQLDEIKELNKLQADKSKELRDEKVKLDEADRVRNISDFVSDSISSGITDVNEIYRELRKAGIAGSDAEVNKALKNLYTKEEIKEENPLEKLSIDFRDFDYLSNSPNRGGLPDVIKTPMQYIQYRRQLEQDIKNNANTPSPNGISPADSPRGTPDQIDISSLEGIKNLPISDLTKAYMSGFFPGKPTPTDARTIAEELYKVGFNPKQYINRKLEGLVALYASIPEDQKGLLEGFIKPWAKYTQPTVGTFESARAVLTREVARLNDVGVLSDQDVKSYTDAMPSRMDKDITQVIAKLSGLQLATGGKVSKEAGKTGKLKDGRAFIIGTDGKTLLDPNTGEKIQ